VRALVARFRHQLTSCQIIAFADESRTRTDTGPSVLASFDNRPSDETVVPNNAPTTLMEWAVLILNTPNAVLKVERTRHAVEQFRTGKLKSIGRHKEVVPPTTPPREKSMVVVDPTKVARRGKGGSLKSRITMLHALANIEQWA
jgi:hypothetical protein